MKTDILQDFPAFFWAAVMAALSIGLVLNLRDVLLAVKSLAEWLG